MTLSWYSKPLGIFMMYESLHSYLQYRGCFSKQWHSLLTHPTILNSEANSISYVKHFILIIEPEPCKLGACNKMKFLKKKLQGRQLCQKCLSFQQGYTLKEKNLLLMRKFFPCKADPISRRALCIEQQAGSHNSCLSSFSQKRLKMYQAYPSESALLTPPPSLTQTSTHYCSNCLCNPGTNRLNRMLLPSLLLYQQKRNHLL